MCSYGHFRSKRCPHLNFYLEDGGSRSLRNLGNHQKIAQCYSPDLQTGNPLIATVIIKMPVFFFWVHDPRITQRQMSRRRVLSLPADTRNWFMYIIFSWYISWHQLRTDRTNASTFIINMPAPTTEDRPTQDAENIPEGKRFIQRRCVSLMHSQGCTLWN
jgi:hypothetical protein